ncbi:MULTISPECIES: hypothetical protein [Bradyrhizobium]|uniref:hypothetical protein n=1 Tax=Bradyrhizobium TaxID=374 RepID=UPI00195ED2A4|nr:hypothetical protein [Bradyrhizobium canariense]MBM7486107.1 hypothetical protein [Bradyrhizobium canariense]
MIFQYRFTYRAEYFLWKGKKKRPVFLTALQPVEIAEVDPAAAPPAYRILSEDRGYRETHEVRSFGGMLWWQIFDHADPLTPAAFLALASANWERASRVLDPTSRTYYLDASSAEVFLAQRRVSKGKFWPECEPQERQAKHDASKLMFCGDYVYVAAGDPVWYAICDEAAGRVDFVIGHSDLDRYYLDRPYGVGFFTPGPDRKNRISCGRRSHVFGLDEVSSALPALAESGHEPRFGSEIVSLSEHHPRASAAAELCVRASAEHLREIAWRKPELRKAIPELEDTSRDGQTDLPADKSLLARFVESRPALRKPYEQPIVEAQAVLDRLARHECLADDDEAALASLGFDSRDVPPA